MDSYFFAPRNPPPFFASRNPPSKQPTTATNPYLFASSRSAKARKLPFKQPTTPTPTLPNAPSSPPLPHLPSPTFPPDTTTFDTALSTAVQDLQSDTTSTSRHFTSAALRHLTSLVDVAALASPSYPEFCTLLVYAAKQLSFARPNKGAVVTACLLRALERIARRWNEERTTDWAGLAGSVLAEVARERMHVSEQLDVIAERAEWVPASVIDGYVVEMGEHVEAASKEVQGLKEHIFE
ncbi:hypothetical protein CC86DRAFT_402458 [Ophiobolus disseminans]|uniref:Uncharacterized protein n=1 Tax=Ophiobolus disseminans TaxID=1469910 RepID=A0A6A7ACV2_9PLEO|nr:hypothetical protein CC86DRAFT_402458 [Ophiobolus disseminans]